MTRKITRIQKMGERIRKRRIMKGYTQEKLAEQMEVSVQTISNAERGVRTLTQENMIRLCTLLDSSIDYMLTGKTTARDSDILIEKLNRLSPSRRSSVEFMIDNLLAEQEREDK